MIPHKLVAHSITLSCAFFKINSVFSKGIKISFNLVEFTFQGKGFPIYKDISRLVIIFFFNSCRLNDLKFLIDLYSIKIDIRLFRTYNYNFVKITFETK